MRQPKVHAITHSYTTLCKTRGHVFMTHLPQDVTCNLCIYRMWRAGLIDDSDTRITQAMRDHRAAAERADVRPA